MTTRPIITNPALLDQLKYNISNRKKRAKIHNLTGKVFQRDAMEYLFLFPDNSVDLLITDEPFGQPGHTFFYNGKSGKPAKNPIVRNFNWDTPMPAHLTIPWVYEVSRILKDGGALVNCGLMSWSTSFEDVVHDAGLTFRAHIVWLKSNPMRQIHPGSWRSGHEMIWVASKGTLADRMRGKIKQEQRINYHIEVTCPNCGEVHNHIDSSNYKLLYRSYSELGGLDELPTHLGPFRDGHSRCHDTQKPSWMSKYYIDLLTSRGDVVVDPFAGSGELLLYAAEAERLWGANDKELRNCNNIRLRLSSTERSLFNERVSLLPGDDNEIDQRGMPQL